MPLADAAKVAVFSALTDGVWEKLSSVARPVEDGFDTLDVEYIRDFGATVKTPLQVLADFPQGMRHGTDDFFLRTADPVRRGGNVWSVKAHFEGRISSGKPIKARPLANAEVLNVDSLTYAPAGLTAAPAAVRDCAPSVQIGYVLVGAEPGTDSVGLAGTPDYVPAVRDSFWDDMTDSVRFNWPTGWVLEDMEADKIAGADPVCAYVRETWQYRFDKVPLA